MRIFNNKMTNMFLLHYFIYIYVPHEFYTAVLKPFNMFIPLNELRPYNSRNKKTIANLKMNKVQCYPCILKFSLCTAIQLMNKWNDL